MKVSYRKTEGMKERKYAVCLVWGVGVQSIHVLHIKI